jgi:hypothetical protein
MLKQIPLTLQPPTLEDSVSDLDRLNRGLKKQGCDVARLNVGIKVMRQLAEAVRRDNWNITASVIRRKCANEILEVRPATAATVTGPGHRRRHHHHRGLPGRHDRRHGPGRHRRPQPPGGLRRRCHQPHRLRRKRRGQKAQPHGPGHHQQPHRRSPGQRRRQSPEADPQRRGLRQHHHGHLLLQIEPRYIRRDPYIPTVSDFPILKAGEIGLKANPMAAVFIMPGPASYVGGDIVSGVLYTGFHREDPVTLFIDIGTNGEIVLGNREWLMTAACSAGPAFEGGGIRWGMRAEEGAIEKYHRSADAGTRPCLDGGRCPSPGHLRVGHDRPDCRTAENRHR